MNIKYKNNKAFMTVLECTLENGIYELDNDNCYLVVCCGRGWYSHTLARAQAQYDDMEYHIQTGWLRGWALHSKSVCVRKIS